MPTTTALIRRSKEIELNAISSESPIHQYWYMNPDYISLCILFSNRPILT